MDQMIEQQHDLDGEGNPAGGTTRGTGFEIRWQNGPLGRGADRKEPNGAFVEGIITAARGRLEHYQAGKFACQENQTAIEHLTAALAALSSRTAAREAAGVEGTHEVAPKYGEPFDLRADVNLDHLDDA